MIESKIIWHNASEELPSKSCKVLIACVNVCGIYYVSNTYYSSRHKAFNCQDSFKDDSTKLEKVKYWAYSEEKLAQLEADLFEEKDR